MSAVAAAHSGPHPSPPAMACAVLRCQGASARVEAGCAGVRRAGSGAECQAADRWHLGSDTKAVTAVLASVCVERGEVGWGTSVEAALPGLEVHEGYAGVTLEQLLTHTSGAPGTAPPDAWALAWRSEEAGDPPAEQRRGFVAALLQLPPAAARGSYEYSNQGYAIAGHMLETLLGTSYEDLVTACVLQPLGITSAGFGAAPGDEDPWGHAQVDGEEGWSPCDPAVLGSDNPTAISPAGRLHMSIEDWGRFVAAVVSPEVAESKLGLPLPSWRRLHEPLVQMPEGAERYGLGWMVCERPWAAGGRALTHSGSNTMNYCTAWAVPASEEQGEESGKVGAWAVLVACNAGGEAAGVVGAAVDEIVLGELSAAAASI